MAGPKAKHVDETIAVTGVSLSGAMDRVKIVMRHAAEFTVTEPSEGVLHLARSGRGVLGRKIELCTITMHTEPQRLVVSIHGPIAGEHLASIRAALMGRAVDEIAGPSSGSFAPPGVVGDPPPAPVPAGRVSGGQVITSVPGFARVPRDEPARARLTPLPTPLDRTPPVAIRRPEPAPRGDEAAGATMHNRRAGGEKKVIVRLLGEAGFVLRDVAVLGRNPAPGTDDPAGTRAVSLDDLSVSKTHVAIGRAGDAVWVEDRHSTNGTSIVGIDGVQRPLEPGRREVVDLPTQLLVGDVPVRVGWSE